MKSKVSDKRVEPSGMLRVWSSSGSTDRHRLKEIVAIIRPERWQLTKQSLRKMRVYAFSQQRVLGRGRARGLQYLPKEGASKGVGVHYLPKRMVSWFVLESDVDRVVQAVIQANQTGQLGDGRIFVLPVDSVVRIRTGDRGWDALRPEHQFESVLGYTEKASHAAGE